jgi:hypothetical protein
MASISTPPAGKYEWLVVVPDKPGQHEKRLEVRALVQLHIFSTITGNKNSNEMKCLENVGKDEMERVF